MELPVTSADVLLLVRNERAALSLLLPDGTGLDAASVRDMGLPSSASELLASWSPPKAGRGQGNKGHDTDGKEIPQQPRRASSLSKDPLREDLVEYILYG